MVKNLPDRWRGKITFCKTCLETLVNAQTLVIGTEWPEFNKTSNKISTIAKPNLVIIDPNRHLDKTVLKADIRYITVGNLNE